MKANIKCAIAIVAFAAIPAVANGLDEPVKVNTKGLQPHVAQEVQKRADQSMEALMQYLWFTRKVHRLWIEDVTKPSGDTIASNETEQKREQYAIRATGLR